MRRRPIITLMFVLGLLAAVAATPLRLAEAASDQARTLAELDGDPEIEPIDGGVGDDSGATIRSLTLVDFNLIHLDLSRSEFVTIADNPIPLDLVGTIRFSPLERAEDVPRRLAILQRFLI